MKRILSTSFFNRDARVVARELLGKYLARKIHGKTRRFMIIETEAYVGPHDLASHASKGRTKRTETMFGPPGHAYIYLIYGMYYCLNVVTGKDGHPAAVLIRGLKGENLNGPGKICRALNISKTLNGASLTTHKNGLWIEDGGTRISSRAISKSPRIGVDYAGEWSKKPFRYSIFCHTR